jgi:resuscitation-promoting factor RpfB
VFSQDSRARPGIARAALAGVAVLLFGPIIAPFTTYDFGYARGGGLMNSQTFTNDDVERHSITKDSWSMTSGFFVASSRDVKAAQSFARTEVESRGWGEEQFTCLVDLWNRESRWNYRAENASSGAYGIPQALPGNKMRSAGKDWRDNPQTQILWGLTYIAERYSTPCKAWGHSEENGWY